MHKLSICAASLAAALIAVIPASGRAAATPELNDRVRLILKAAQAIEEQNIWPGFSLLSQPILLYETGKKAFLIAHPDPPAEYTTIQAKPVAVHLRRGPIHDVNFVFSMDYPVNEHSCFVLRYDTNDSPATDCATVIHERFHVFQDTAFKNMPGTERYELEDPENQALAVLEQRALAKALRADRDSRPRYAGMFVAVRTLRNKQFGQHIQSIENGEERLEGMPYYVERKTMAALSNSEEISNFRLLPILDRLMNRPTLDDMEKSRYYGTGAAQAYLLDLAGDRAWKQAVAQGTSLFDRMAGNYSVPADTLKGFVEEAKTELLGYSSLVAEAEVELQKRAARMAAEYKRFDRQPGLRFSISVPLNFSVQYGFEGKKYTAPGHDALYAKMRHLSMREDNFLMSLSRRPVQMGRSVIKFYVREEACTINRDAKMLRLDQPGNYDFKSLTVHGNGFDLTSKLPGTVSIRPGEIAIHIHQPE